MRKYFFKAFRNNYLAALIIILSFSAKAQTLKDLGGTGQISNDFMARNAFLLPSDTVTTKAKNSDVDSCQQVAKVNGIVYSYNCLLHHWVQIVSGISLALDSARRSNDTLFFRYTTGGELAVKMNYYTAGQIDSILSYYYTKEESDSMDTANSITASNGLTRVGNDIQLGGTFGNDGNGRTITGNNNKDFTLKGTYVTDYNADRFYSLFRFRSNSALLQLSDRILGLTSAISLSAAGMSLLPAGAFDVTSTSTDQTNRIYWDDATSGINLSTTKTSTGKNSSISLSSTSGNMDLVSTDNISFNTNLFTVNSAINLTNYLNPGLDSILRTDASGNLHQTRLNTTSISGLPDSLAAQTLQVVTNKGNVTTNNMMIGSSSQPSKKLHVTGSSLTSDTTFIGDPANTTMTPALVHNRNISGNTVSVVTRQSSGYITAPGRSLITYPYFATGISTGNPAISYVWSHNIGAGSADVTFRSGTSKGVWIGPDTLTNSILKLYAYTPAYGTSANVLTVKDSTQTQFLWNLTVKNNRPRLAFRDSTSDYELHVPDSAHLRKALIGDTIPLTALFPWYDLTLPGGLLMMYSNGSSNPTIESRRFNGTFNAPTTILKGQSIIGLMGAPYNGTSFGTKGSVSILASEDHTVSTAGTYIAFQTTNKGATARRNVLIVTDSGHIMIGNLSTGAAASFNSSNPYDSSIASLDIIRPTDTASHFSIAVRGKLPGSGIYMKRTSFSVTDAGNTYTSGLEIGLSGTAKYDTYYRDSATNRFVRLPPGTFGQYYQAGPGGKPQWVSPGFGSGTVTSVALSLPSIFSVSGSPITTTGTLTGTLATQSANIIFAGPTTGGAAAPTFRALVVNDIPSLSSLYLNNSNAAAQTARAWINGSLRVDSMMIYTYGNPGVGKTLIDSTGTGVMVWRTPSGGNVTALKDVYTSQGNSSSTPNNYTALHTFNVAANTLTANGQKILMTSGGVYSATVGTKDLQVFINGNGCGTFLSTSVSDGWQVDVFFIRTGTTTGTVVVRTTGGTALSDAITTDLTGLDYTGAITFAVWGASGTGTVNDVTAKLTRWVFEQAAP